MLNDLDEAETFFLAVIIVGDILFAISIFMLLFEVKNWFTAIFFVFGLISVVLTYNFISIISAKRI